MLIFSGNKLLEQPVAMKKSLFIILTFSLFNCGCSTIGLVYRNADWYLQHKIYGYTTFNSQQKEAIRKDVSNYMVWHRQEALPEYIIFLQNLNGVAQYDGHLESGQITLLRARLMDLYQKSLVPAIKPVAQMLSSLDSRQIQELGSNLAEENQKQEQEELNVSHDEYLERRADKTITFLEWLAGNLSNDQEQKVREMSRHLPVVSQIFIQHREANQGRLLALLNNHAGADKIAVFMSTWILNPKATRTSQQQRDIESFEAASDEMIAQIHGLLTDRQKEHIHKLISSYIKEMQSFATDGLNESKASHNGLSS
jgi:hypothetical protein